MGEISGKVALKLLTIRVSCKRARLSFCAWDMLTSTGIAALDLHAIADVSDSSF